MSGNKRISFVGAGNMAEALVKGILSKKLVDACDIVVTDISEDRLTYFKTQYRVEAVKDLAQAVQQVDVLFLAVKPQVFGALLPQIKTVIDRDKTTVVSIAAGITTVMIEKALGEGTSVVRVMPNTPALVGAGAAGLCAGCWTTSDQADYISSLLESVGMAVCVDEGDMDAVTALSGSGPAYVFYLIEAMQAAAVDAGLAEVVANKLALATLKGAVELCEETGVSAEELRQRVTSKGGTTAAAIGVFDQNGLKQTIMDGMRAARVRSEELSAMM